MPDLEVEPESLAAAGEELAAQGRAVARAAGPAQAALGGVHAALPGTRSAAEAERLSDAIVHAVEKAAHEADELAVALSTAAGCYAAADREAAEVLTSPSRGTA